MGSLSKRLSKKFDKPDLELIARKLREGAAKTFVDFNGVTPPVIAYRITPDSHVYIIPHANNAPKDVFYKYLENVSHRQPTIAIIFMAHANLKQRNSTVEPGDGNLNNIDTLSEILIQLIQEKNGNETVWFSSITRNPLQLTDWKKPTNAGGFRPLFGYPN